MFAAFNFVSTQPRGFLVALLVWLLGSSPVEVQGAREPRGEALVLDAAFPARCAAHSATASAGTPAAREDQLGLTCVCVTPRRIGPAGAGSISTSAASVSAAGLGVRSPARERQALPRGVAALSLDEPTETTKRPGVTSSRAAMAVSAAQTQEGARA